MERHEPEQPLQREAGIQVGRRPIARHVPDDCDLANDRVAAEWENNVVAYLTALSHGKVFDLAAVMEVPGCSPRMHDAAKDFVGAEHLPGAIAKEIVGEVDRLVLDRTVCPLKTRERESFSMHAGGNGPPRMLDIARLADTAKPVERVGAVVETVIELRDKGELLLSPRAPVVASQPDAAADPIRRLLAGNGLSYAMRLAPDAYFKRIELNADGAYDGPDDYSVEEAFAIESRVPGRDCVSVIPMRHLIDYTTTVRVAVAEYLVRIHQDDAYRYFVARPSSPLLAPADGRFFAASLELAEKAVDIPISPLADEYGAHLFNHPNPIPWENTLRIVARAVAAGTIDNVLPADAPGLA